MPNDIYIARAEQRLTGFYLNEDFLGKEKNGEIYLGVTVFFWSNKSGSLRKQIGA